MPACTHYLKAVTRSRAKPMARRSSPKMKEMPTDDALFGKGTIRADGRKVHDAYLFEVKTPAESKYAGTSTSCARPSRQQKPSVRSRTAAARWSAADATRHHPLASCSAASGSSIAHRQATCRGADAVFEIFGIPSQALFSQLLIGLINGSFYALLSLGLAVIFGMLNIINFAHGAQYMMGAFAAFLLLQYTRSRLLAGACCRAGPRRN